MQHAAELQELASILSIWNILFWNDWCKETYNFKESNTMLIERNKVSQNLRICSL